jgi:nucleoid-associated protein YgaU
MKFLSRSDFAVRHKVSRQTISEWSRRGLVTFAPDGRRVDVTATEALLAARPSRYRGGRPKGPHAVDDATNPQIADDTVPIGDDAAELDAAGATLVDWQKRKEKALCEIREHELQTRRGRYAPVEAMGRRVEDEYGIVRERFLSIPGKVSDALVGQSRVQIESVLIAEISEALNELSAPSELVQQAINEEKT